MLLKPDILLYCKHPCSHWTHSEVDTSTTITTATTTTISTSSATTITTTTTTISTITTTIERVRLFIFSHLVLRGCCHFCPTCTMNIMFICCANV